MQVWGLSEAEIRACATLARVAIYGDRWDEPTGGIYADGKALRVRLKVDPGQPRNGAGMLPYQSRGRSYGGRQGRRLSSVTWEGHREFMWFVFRFNPEARIKSAIADYKGKADFVEKHPETRGLWQGPGY